MIKQRKVQSTLTIEKIPIIVLHFSEKRFRNIEKLQTFDFRDINSHGLSQTLLKLSFLHLMSLTGDFSEKYEVPITTSIKSKDFFLYEMLS